MAKILVVDSERGTQVPFLRGILTRSLQDAGMTFEEAYGQASEVRRELGETATITTRELRTTVLRGLRQSQRRQVAQRYRARFGATAAVLVESEHGHQRAFSRAYHQGRLESSGLQSEQAAALTHEVYHRLLARRESHIDSRDLDVLTQELLEQEQGGAAARRYRLWTDFLHSGRPLILLIGGTAGCGKSTTATAIANRLDIVRTQSTDMLREVMRVMIPERLLPVLHKSSFDAWTALPGQEEPSADPDVLLADGYRAQAQVLALSGEAVVQRALRERVSLILEGVHMQPAFYESLSTYADALVVPIMLAVLHREELRKRIRGRGWDVPERRAKRYLKHFDEIWRLQAFLLTEADRQHVAIIENNDQEQVFQAVMRIIIDLLEQPLSERAAGPAAGVVSRES
jgi:2-phosphoglycerate kinase